MFALSLGDGFHEKTWARAGCFGGVHFWARLNAFNSLGAFFCPSAQVWFHPVRRSVPALFAAFRRGRTRDERGREPGKEYWRIARDSNSLNITQKLSNIRLVDVKDGEFDFAFSPAPRPSSRLIFRNGSARAPAGRN